MIRAFLLVLVALPSLVLGDTFGGYTLSPEQQRLMSAAYILGSPHDLGETTQAILFQETLAGGFGDGIGDKINGHMKESYGVMQIKIVTVKWILWKKPELVTELFGEYPTDMEIREALLGDDILNIRLGVENLLLLKYHTDSWSELVVAYNTGLNGMRVLEDVRSHHYHDLVVKKLRLVVRPLNKHLERETF